MKQSAKTKIMIQHIVLDRPL